MTIEWNIKIIERKHVIFAELRAYVNGANIFVVVGPDGWDIGHDTLQRTKNFDCRMSMNGVSYWTFEDFQSLNDNMQKALQMINEKKTAKNPSDSYQDFLDFMHSKDGPLTNNEVKKMKNPSKIRKYILEGIEYGDICLDDDLNFCLTISELAP